MPFWTFHGLRKGSASTDWPKPGADDGQTGVLGLPRFDLSKCVDGCRDCADACLPDAITVKPDGNGVDLDYARCVSCQLCVEACPTGAFSTSQDWAYGVRKLEDLKWKPDTATSDDAEALKGEIRRVFGRSLHIRHVDAGSCNGCESELHALNNPFYNMHRLGIFITPSPRFADLLLVTGPVTYAMKGPLLAAYEAMPEPKFVMAMGVCACSGGTNGGGYACGNGLDGVLPVDIWLPGCPPNPAAILHALLMLLQRAPQRVHNGQIQAEESHV